MFRSRPHGAVVSCALTSSCAPISSCALTLSFVLALAVPCVAQTTAGPRLRADTPIAGQTPGPSEADVHRMTFAEAIAYAREHQPAVRASIARIAAAKTAAEIPRSQWYPVFGATAELFEATANNTTGTYVSEPFMDVPRIGATRAVADGNLRPYPSTFVGLGGSQELFDFGRIAAEAAVRDAEIDVAKERARADMLTVVYDVEEAYFAVFAAKAILKASQDAYDRSRVHRDLAKAGVDSGLRSPIELTRAEADLTKFDMGRVRAEGGLSTAEEVFAATIGAPEQKVDIAAAPPSPADLPSLDLAVQQATSRNPRLLQAIAELREDEANTRAIGAALRPDLSFTATISGRAGGAAPSGNGDTVNGGGWIPNVPNWDVGVVLSFPLFNATVNARKQSSLAVERVRRAEIEVTREREIADIRQAYVVVNVARATLPGLERAIEAARANYAQADARFRAELGTSVELADAEALRTEAEIQLALGQFELARTRAAFGRAIAEGI